MEKNCIIIHGSPSRDKQNEEGYIPENKVHWMPWLRENLEAKDIEVEMPLMPTPWNPDYNEWKEVFEKLSINENSILVGHSAGGAFLVRWLGETETKVKKLILIAASKETNEASKRIKDLCDFEVNSKIKELVGEIIIFISNDDEGEEVRSADFYKQELDGELISFENKGHFCARDGVTEFPELLNKILEDE